MMYLYTATLKRFSAALDEGVFRMAEGRAFHVVGRLNGKDRCSMSGLVAGRGFDN